MNLYQKFAQEKIHEGHEFTEVGKMWDSEIGISWRIEQVPPELIEAYLRWYQADGGWEVRENQYTGIINKDYLSQLSDKDFIETLYQFAHVGGGIQSGGNRTSDRFREMVRANIGRFRNFVMEPFGESFDPIDWLGRTDVFNFFGQGLATIYLNRVDKNKFPILNDKTVKSLAELGFKIKSNGLKRYNDVRLIQEKLIKRFPQLDNFNRADFLNEFISRDEGKTLIDKYYGSPTSWIIAPGRGAEHWDDCKTKGIIRIGYDEIHQDLHGLSEQEVDEVYDKSLGTEAGDIDKKGIIDFCCVMKPGDFLFVKKGKRILVGYGKVTSEYKYDHGLPTYRHYREVEWLKTGEWPLPEATPDLPTKTLTPTSTSKNSSEDLLRLMESGPNMTYSLERCAGDTGFDITTLKRWVRAIERKRQAIIYGPPGTGKTFIANKLAKHLLGGDDGFVELVQFHPAYAYEDFIQGIRPRTMEGQLEYFLEPGRFLSFCKKAEACKGTCVLIVDEINRANLARVFGELMYLLEYRNDSIPLAGGNTLKIPDNVRILGTMNTADRSIALVDHALRRRFAFIGLYPNYDVLEYFHKKNGTGIPVSGLIEVLKKLNQQISDKHYHIGISFFLVDKLQEHLPDIWRMEIEPFLEEYFFDHPEKVDDFCWEKVKGSIGL